MTNQQSTPATKYIAYYRVSTQKQSESGLGLEAQKSEVIRTIGNNGIIVNSYTDIESGKKNNRANLEAAISECKKAGAILIIAKLDRLSRDVEFLFKLKNSGIEIKACDLSDFNTLTLGIFATMAQHERELISKRTKAALQAKKDNGIKLGSPIASQTLKENCKLGHAANKEQAANNPNNIKAISLITALRNGGKNWNQIAIELNKNGFQTAKGKEFGITQVQRLYERSLTA